MNNGNGLKDWYPNIKLLQEALVSGYCVIARQDCSFGVIVFSKPLLENDAPQRLQRAIESHSVIGLNFQVIKSLCFNCGKKEIGPGTNACPDCAKLYACENSL